jgi:hypothetical protein
MAKLVTKDWSLTIPGGEYTSCNSAFQEVFFVRHLFSSNLSAKRRGISSITEAPSDSLTGDVMNNSGYCYSQLFVAILSIQSTTTPLSYVAAEMQRRNSGEIFLVRPHKSTLSSCFVPADVLTFTPEHIRNRTTQNNLASTSLCPPNKLSSCYWLASAPLSGKSYP